MEVHPPHEAIHSVKEFTVHMLAITLGLLIALGLEATVEWLHHRSLVREARENIRQEISENQRNLAAELKSLPAEKTREGPREASRSRDPAKSPAASS